METTADDPAFVDTNILVYANNASAPLQEPARSALIALVESGVELWINRQVVREYLATLSRPQLCGEYAGNNLVGPPPGFKEGWREKHLPVHWRALHDSRVESENRAARANGLPIIGPKVERRLARGPDRSARITLRRGPS